MDDGGLKITERQREAGRLTVALVGVLDSATVSQFDQQMQDIAEKDVETLLLALDELAYISSAGIGSLMDWTQRLRTRGGELILVSPTAKVTKILELLGLTRIFRIVATEEEARALSPASPPSPVTD